MLTYGIISSDMNGNIKTDCCIISVITYLIITDISPNYTILCIKILETNLISLCAFG